MPETIYSKAKWRKIDQTFKNNEAYIAGSMKDIVADPEREEDVAEQTVVWQPQDDELLKEDIHGVVTKQLKGKDK